MYNLGKNTNNLKASMATSHAQNIQVAVRCRPLNDREGKLNSYSIIECNDKAREVHAFDKSGHLNIDKKYTFDKVFGVTSKQSEVYNQVVKPVVLEVIEGYNCTIFAYGQTGTGKTHTMEGDWSSVTDSPQSWENDQRVGIIPRSVAHLFTCLNSIQNCEFSVKVSFIELYNEELSDLLSDSSNENEKLRIFEDPARKGSVTIPGLEEIVVKNRNEVYSILKKGSTRRQQAATLMNAKSSRSHSIFTCTVFIKEKSIEGEETIKVGKLNLVDLAGSENIERSGATGKRAAEAGRINKSLTTLGRVITALVEHRDHIPYRESNLTRLLQDSLGGRTKTTLIATISPALCNLEETLSTLDYANKAKSIRNKPEVNQKLVKKALIKEYTEEIDKLKRELFSSREKNGIYMPQDLYDDMNNQISNQKDEIREQLSKISALTEDMEKLEEQYTDTKMALGERTNQLKKTTETLQATEKDLEIKKVECTETNYLLGEHVKTEDNLWMDADELQRRTVEQNQESCALYSKLDRVNEVNTHNQELTDQFAKHISASIMDLTKKDLALSVEHTNSLCNVCDALHEVAANMEDMKVENTCQLNIFDQKQQNWLGLQQKFVQDEIQQGFQQFYSTYIERAADVTRANEAQCEADYKLCQEHHTLYMKTYETLKSGLEEVSNRGADFKEEFTESSENFRSKVEAESTKDSAAIVKEIKALVSSVSETSEDLKDFKESTDHFKSALRETVSTFHEMFTKFTASMDDNFSKLESKLAKIEEKNADTISSLNKLKKTTRERTDRRVEHCNEDFKDLIAAPISEHLEANCQTLSELKKLSVELTEVYEKTSAQYKSTLESTGESISKNMANLSELSSKQGEKLNSQCAKLTEEMSGFSKESNRFFENFNANSIEHEFNELLDTVSAVTQEVKVTNHSIGLRSEDTQQFCSESISAVNIFAKAEYASVETTGQTPKKKEFDAPKELPRTRDHNELLDSFRGKSGESEEGSDDKSPGRNSQELHKAATECNLASDAKQEFSNPLKRVHSESNSKENQVSEKETKKLKSGLPKGAGFGSKTTAKRPVFGLSNK